MSLTKLSTTTVIPGTPAVAARPYSRYCPPAPLPGGGTTSGPHGAVVSSYAVPITRQDCYSCPPYVVMKVCTVYADGYVDCVIQDVQPGGTGTT